MKRFSLFLFYATIAFLLLWQLPWCYNFFAVKSDRAPFTLYSTVIGDFVQMIPEEGKGVKRCDLSGHTYTEAEFDSILPTFYARQLMSDERFPDSIQGVAVTPRQIQRENFTFRSSPSDVNAPCIGLYPLLESLSGRVDLEMPDDVFRITKKGIEFIDMESNSLNVDKSQLFTQAMRNKGFSFPALEISGNPTTRKEYDEGYVLLDAKHQLFHLKQMRGRPYVRLVAGAEKLRLKHLYITEFSNKKTLAFMIDENHGFYVLNAPSYEIKKTGVTRCNPETDDLIILGDMFNWTVKVGTPESVNYYALDASSYALVKQHEERQSSQTMPGLTFTSYLDNYVFPRFE